MHIAWRMAPFLAAILLAPVTTHAQTAAQLAALRGLAPASALSGTTAGRAALAANLTVTSQIQEGKAGQPTLLPFSAQQQQAVKDAFTTIANGAGLADGLGSALGGAYQSVARYTSTDGGRTFKATGISPTVDQVLVYAHATSHSDSGMSKFFFANQTLDGRTPASPEARAILAGVSGTPDVFGKAYGMPAGAPGGSPYGNTRPFMTRHHYLAYEARDFFGGASTNTAYLHGPAEDIADSPSYPSGHATYGYTQALVLALLVPARYPQMVVRAAEYGNDRIIVGAHYAMDVLGGRALAEYDLAQLLAGRPGYTGVRHRTLTIDDFRRALTEARADLEKVLADGCGDRLPACARHDDSRFGDAQRDEAFYESTQTYGLPVVYRGTADGREDVARLAPEAGYLLTAAFPYLTLEEADAILTDTEGPGGGFLDNGTSFGVYSRLDLYKAAQRALARDPKT
jgi:hypothetical protein